MSHNFYELYYHVIWSTKNRLELINDKINSELRKLILVKADNLAGKVIEFNGYLDHCHLLCIVPPQISLSDFVGQIKGNSAYEVNKILGGKNVQWQQGFGILTLNQKGISTIQKYIKNQKIHHSENSIIKILEYVPIPSVPKLRDSGRE